LRLCERRLGQLDDLLVVALGQSFQCPPPRLAEIPAKRGIVEIFDRNRAAFKPRQLVAGGNGAEIEDRQRQQQRETANEQLEMEGRLAKLAGPIVPPAAREGD